MLEPRALHSLLHLPLCVVVGHEILGLLVRPERRHEHEALDARVFRGGDEVDRALLHHALELLGRAGQERDEVHDDLLSLDCPPQAGGVRHVALNGLLARQRVAAPLLPLEHAHGVAGIDECLHDRRADEPRRACDEDPHDSKFFQ